MGDGLGPKPCSTPIRQKCSASLKPFTFISGQSPASPRLPAIAFLPKRTNSKARRSQTAGRDSVSLDIVSFHFRRGNYATSPPEQLFFRRLAILPEETFLIKAAIYAATGMRSSLTIASFRSNSASFLSNSSVDILSISLPSFVTIVCESPHFAGFPDLR